MLINTNYPCHSTNYRKERRDSIKYIVIHYVGATGSAENNVIHYGNPVEPKASAHYYVGHAKEEGRIYQSVPDQACAFHCGTSGKYYHECRNDSSIGIEMCCHKRADGTWYFDDITVEKTIELVRFLMDKYSIPIGNVIRHYDVTRKICPAPFVSDSGAWVDFKAKLVKTAELESVNDIVWELAERGIISDKALWMSKLEEDTNAYWLARKAVNYIVALN